MPDTRSLTPLFEAIGHQDLDSSLNFALEIVSREESKGNRKVAGTLRGALNGLGQRGISQHSIGDQSKEFQLSKALVRFPVSKNLEEVSLRKAVRTDLAHIVEEWQAAKELARAGLERRSRLLFHGPPGCGKTVTAAALADALSIPAYIVRFNALIGSYLGQTALNLCEVFRFIAKTQCILILDELDVLGKHRGNQMDVGELDRIVVSLMQELDLANPKGLIIGATNLPDHLDAALWRRFDAHLEFAKPNKTEKIAFARKAAKPYNLKLTEATREKISHLPDYASVEKLILDEARRKVVRTYLANAKSK